MENQKVVDAEISHFFGIVLLTVLAWGGAILMLTVAYEVCKLIHHYQVFSSEAGVLLWDTARGVKYFILEYFMTMSVLFVTATWFLFHKLLGTPDEDSST